MAKTNKKIADLIEAFVSNQKDLDPWAWDDFTTVRSNNLDHEIARLTVLRIERDHQPDKPGTWCSQSGVDHLLKLAKTLREISR